MNDRASLLLALLDAETVEELKRRLSPSQRADLIMELINPHRPLTTDQVADLGGVSPRAVRDRKARGGK